MSQVIRMCPDSGKWETWNLEPDMPALSFCDNCLATDETTHPRAGANDLLPDLEKLIEAVRGLKDEDSHHIIADDMALHRLMSLTRRALMPPMGGRISWPE